MDASRQTPMSWLALGSAETVRDVLKGPDGINVLETQWGQGTSHGSGRDRPTSEVFLPPKPAPGTGKLHLHLSGMQVQLLHPLTDTQSPSWG